MPQAKKATPEVEAPNVEHLHPAQLQHGNPMVVEEINAAVALLKQQRDIQKQIGENRDTLRLLDKREKLSEPQGEWLDSFYTQKAKGERKTAEETAKTKAVRAIALGVSADEVSEDDE